MTSTIQQYKGVRTEEQELQALCNRLKKWTERNLKENYDLNEKYGFSKRIEEGKLDGVI